MPERIASVNLLPVPAGLAAEVAAMVEPLACCLRGVDRASSKEIVSRSSAQAPSV